MPSEFYPKYGIISAISRGQTTTVTFTEDCDFTDGEIVSFRVSRESGTWELNNQQARVMSHTSDTITVDIDSTNYTAFVAIDENEQVHVSMVVPSSSGIIPGQSTATMNLEDAFDHRLT